MKMALASSRPVLLALAASLIFSPIGRAADAPSIAGAKSAIPASPLATTEQAIDQRLEGKFLFIRGFYLDDKLEFDLNGKIVGAPQKGSFTLSALEIKKVHSTKKSIVIEADRIGLHFFGGLPYEDDNKPFERIKVSKKPLEITIDRLVIEPEKKKKQKKGDKAVAAAKPATTPAGTTVAGATPAAPTTPAATDASNSGVANPPDVTFDEADNKTAAGTPDLTSKAAPAIIAKPPVDAAHHDPKESWMQLSKALDQIFATGLDDTVIATLPDYWQVYFATKAGKQQSERIDNSVLRPGNGVVSPKLLSSLEPSSNDYAQKNNIAGMTLLSTVVGTSGKPGSVTIVRPIGFGLDEQAVDAVERAHFRPGMHDGQPVPVAINVQVTFRIYSDRTRPTPGAAPEPVAPAQPASAPAPSHTSNGKEVASVN